MIKNFDFSYFLAAADADEKHNYKLELTNALSRFGVDQVVLATVEKKHDEDTLVILAKNEFNEYLGGIRIEILTAENKIPLIKSSMHYLNIFKQKINLLEKNNQQVAEICGLWVSPKAKGLGLGRRLAKEATELASDMGFEYLVSMLPTHTLDFFTDLGFEPDQDIPPMAYPDDRYISTVVWKHNSKSLDLFGQAALKTQDFSAPAL